jgi:ribonucleotide reductase alpha subunit
VQHDTLDDPRFINQLQQDNWISKYRFNGENLEEYFWRIAYGAASVEKTDELREHWANEYYSILDDFQFTVGGRISANIGTGLASKTMMNCYINGPVTNAKIEYTRTAENGLTIPCEINTPSTPDRS